MIDEALESRGGPDAAVFIALGGNDKGGWPSQPAMLEAALARFADAGVTVIARSSWWRSAAWPDAAEPPFVNGVAQVRTRLAPRALMNRLSALEADFGRVRRRANAPRTLDLDLVAHGRLCGRFSGVVVPHPRAAERLFVMGPLAEIAPDWTHPVTGRTARALAASATVGLDARAMRDGDGG